MQALYRVFFKSSFFSKVHYAPAGFSCRFILAFAPPLCSFSCLSASIIIHLKGQQIKQTLHHLFENFPCLGKRLFYRKAACSHFQLNVEDWNIIVLQRYVCLDLPYWFSDHLHTGGTFDCCVAQSHSTPLCLNNIRPAYTWSLFALCLPPFYRLDLTSFLYSTAVLGSLFPLFFFVLVLRAVFSLPYFL